MYKMYIGAHFLCKIYWLFAWTQAPRYKDDERIYFKFKFEHHRYIHGEKFDGFRGNHSNAAFDTFSKSQTNFMAYGLNVTKPISGKVSVIVYVLSNYQHVKLMTVYLNTKMSTWCTHSICMKFGEFIRYIKLAIFYQLFLYAANA